MFSDPFPALNAFNLCCSLRVLPPPHLLPSFPHTIMTRPLTNNNDNTLCSLSSPLFATLRVHASLVRPIGKSEILIISVTPHSYRIRCRLSSRLLRSRVHTHKYTRSKRGEGYPLIGFFPLRRLRTENKKSFIIIFNVISLCINNNKKKHSFLYKAVYFFSLNLTCDFYLRLIKCLRILYNYTAYCINT